MEAPQRDEAAARKTQIWIAVIAALGGIIAAAIGLAGTLAATNHSITSNDPSAVPTVTKTVSTPGAGTSTSAQVPDSSPSGKRSTKSSSHGVYHTGRISLAANGRTIDFEAPPDDSKWGDGSSLDRISIHYIGELEMTLNAFVVPRGTDATYEFCSSSTLYAPYDSNDSPKLEQGTTLCAQASSGRYGSISIAKRSSKAWTLEITTWRL
jgi:hypothetical protein